MIKKTPATSGQLADQPISCDQVFDRLTAGPFPHDDACDHLQDDRVQRHLRYCHDCRRFAEAMRPAVGLIHESLAERSNNDLPVFNGTLPQDDRMLRTIRNALSESADPGIIEPVGSRKSKSAHRQGKPGYLSAGFLTASILFLFAFFGGLSAYPLLHKTDQMVAVSDTVPPAATTLINFHEPDQPVDQQQFGHWIESVDCQHAVARSQAILLHHDVLNAVLLRDVCCSECHSSADSASLALQTGQIASLVQTCGSCHDLSNTVVHSRDLD